MDMAVGHRTKGAVSIGLVIPVDSRCDYRSRAHSAEVGMKYLELERVVLDGRDRREWTLSSQEALVVPLKGGCRVRASGVRGDWEAELSRSDVFTEAPDIAYLNPGSTVEITSQTGADVLLVMAKADPPGSGSPVFTPKKDVPVSWAGASIWKRQLRLLCFGASSPSSRLIVGETVHPAGNWSGYPPHKHDTANEEESELEELYYFKIDDSGGYAVHQMFEGPTKQAVVVEGDAVALMPRGYHSTAASPGTRVFFLWALAGPKKEYRVTLYPQLRWVAKAEPLVRGIQER